MSTAVDWKQRWAEGRTRFHSEDVHADLLAHADRFLGGSPRHVLVPLCGKSVDMRHLADQGHRVTGVELVPEAVEQFWAETGVEPERGRHGAFERTHHGSIELLRGDVLELAPGPYDRMWDRAALVALPADTRATYVHVLRRALNPGAVALLNAFTYDTSVMDGPPFCVNQDEVRRLYAGCDIEVQSERDAIDMIPFEGHSYWLVTTYLIQLPTA